MAPRHLFTSAAGIRHYWEDNGATKLVRSFQDIDPILDHNQAMATHNDGYTPSRDMRRVGSIPMALIMKWRNEEGWDPFSPDPGCQAKLRQKLNDLDFLKLRSAPGAV